MTNSSAENASTTTRTLTDDYAQRLLANGIALLKQRNGSAAVIAFRELAALQPHCPQVWNNYGVALYQIEDFSGAIACYRRALEIAPGFAGACLNLGNAYLLSGDFEQAIAVYRHALTLNPDMPEVHCNLGSALKELGKEIEAEACYTKSLSLDPMQPATHFNLANLWEANENFQGASKHYEECLRLQPDRLLRRLREITICPTVFPDAAAIDDYREMLFARLSEFADRRATFDIRELEADACSPPFNLPYQGRDDRRLKESFARIYHRRIRGWQRPASSRHRGTGRIGFVVTHRHEQAMLRCMGGVLDQLPDDLGELLVFCDERSENILRFGLNTNRVQVITAGRRLLSMAKTICEANPDVLYFWEAGTDKTNYLLPFLRLAPIQCTSFGIPETSGIPNVDYYISSTLLEHPQADRAYTEQLLVLETLLTYYRRRPLIGNRKSVAEFGLPTDRHIYLCPQYLGKFHPNFDIHLGTILRSDSSGIIVIVTNAHTTAIHKLHNRFLLSIGDVADRIVFVPFQSDANYLHLLSAAHVVLDPVYYGGVTTTYDAFSVGTPVVTEPQPFQRGRYAAALYRQIGSEIGVAIDATDYAERAVSLASNDDLRQSVRESIQDRIEDILDDHHVVQAYTEVFRQLLELSSSSEIQ